MCNVIDFETALLRLNAFILKYGIPSGDFILAGDVADMLTGRHVPNKIREITIFLPYGIDGLKPSDPENSLEKLLSDIAPSFTTPRFSRNKTAHSDYEVACTVIDSITCVFPIHPYCYFKNSRTFSKHQMYLMLSTSLDIQVANKTYDLAKLPIKNKQNMKLMEPFQIVEYVSNQYLRGLFSSEAHIPEPETKSEMNEMSRLSSHLDFFKVGPLSSQLTPPATTEYTMQESNGRPIELAITEEDVKATSVYSVLQTVHCEPWLSYDSEIKDGLDLLGIALQLSWREYEQLEAIRDQGPTDTGDLISKGARSTLMNKGLIQVGYVKGEQGYYVCTYKGGDILRIIEAMHKHRKN